MPYGIPYVFIERAWAVCDETLDQIICRLVNVTWTTRNAERNNMQKYGISSRCHGKVITDKQKLLQQIT